MKLFQGRKRIEMRKAFHRIHRAVPPIILGTAFNVLDAVSTGLLVFPSDTGGSTTFKDVQMQAMSMYIMSTILSQLAMTFGGSRFPGALGAMLIEILPFLRNMASDIRQTLDKDSPAIVPTVMAAYALTSFLIGACFTFLGLVRAGRLVSYFPQTVLVGAIGGIGISLFILGLGLPMPPTAESLTLSNAGHVLFSVEHLPLLFASVGPALLLSVSQRSETLNRVSFGFPRNAYYVLAVLGLVPAIFWIVVAGLHLSTAVGTQSLVNKGWLFQILSGSQAPQSELGIDWIYWKLFDFSKIRWRSLGSAVVNIVLVVVIGVLNLPIYVPALALTLDEPFNMDHELIGQGAANLLAGCAGAAPNILQLSYSILFSRAKGGRFEAAVVIALTLVFFFVAPRVLPYVPTVLASALVLFLGIELTLEAVWESAKLMLPTEYLVVIATLVACTFVGFAQGLGVGIGASLLVYMYWRAVDAYGHRRSLWPKHLRSAILQVSDQPCLALQSIPEEELSTEEVRSEKGPTLSTGPVVILQVYVFFGKIPTIEKMLREAQRGERALAPVALDMAQVLRIETSVIQVISRQASNTHIRRLTLCGISPQSELHWEFVRAGVELAWPKSGRHLPTRDDTIYCFGSPLTAARWHESLTSTSRESLAHPPFFSETKSIDPSQSGSVEPVSGGRTNTDNEEIETILQYLLSKQGIQRGDTQRASEVKTQLRKVGISITQLAPGTSFCKPHAPLDGTFWLVVKGHIVLQQAGDLLPKLSRVAVRTLAVRFTSAAWSRLRGISKRKTQPRPTRVGTGTSFGFESDGTLGWSMEYVLCAANDLLHAGADEPCCVAELSQAQAHLLDEIARNMHE